LPCDISTLSDDGEFRRLSDYFDLPIDRLWVDWHVFAPTDRVHRLANVADRWCEEAGMVASLADAATAVAAGQCTAEQAMTRIVGPGYEEAIRVSLEKVERNFSYIERQELRRRVVDVNGRPYDRLPEPLVLHVKGLAERAVAKDLMERTLRAYSAVTKLPPELRMQTAISVSAIVDNEQRMAEQAMRASKKAKAVASPSPLDAPPHSLDGDLRASAPPVAEIRVNPRDLLGGSLSAREPDSEPALSDEENSM
jgi:hypothetical protein